jgi:hypothetical protein
MYIINIINIIIIIQHLTPTSPHFWFVFYTFVQLYILRLPIFSCVVIGPLL